MEKKYRAKKSTENPPEIHSNDLSPKLRLESSVKYDLYSKGGALQPLLEGGIRQQTCLAGAAARGCNGRCGYIGSGSIQYKNYRFGGTGISRAPFLELWSTPRSVIMVWFPDGFWLILGLRMVDVEGGVLQGFI